MRKRKYVALHSSDEASADPHPAHHYYFYEQQRYASNKLVLIPRSRCSCARCPSSSSSSSAASTDVTYHAASTNTLTPALRRHCRRFYRPKAKRFNARDIASEGERQCREEDDADPGRADDADAEDVDDDNNNHHRCYDDNDTADVSPPGGIDDDHIREEDYWSIPGSFPVPQCHNIVSTSQILTSQASIDLQRLADLFPFTTYDRKRFAAITIRLANPHCTCLLFGSGKLVITGSTSFSACIVASHEITRILRQSSPRDTFEVSSCQIQNLVAHVSLPPGTTIDLNRLYEHFNEQSTYQRSIFPGLVLRPPRSPIVLLIFTSGRIVCTGGRSYEDIFFGFAAIYDTLKPFIRFPFAPASAQKRPDDARGRRLRSQP